MDGVRVMCTLGVGTEEGVEWTILFQSASIKQTINFYHDRFATVYMTGFNLLHGEEGVAPKHSNFPFQIFANCIKMCNE